MKNVQKYTHHFMRKECKQQEEQKKKPDAIYLYVLQQMLLDLQKSLM